MTLADEDTNSILTDNANRAFQGNVAMRVTQPGGQLWNQAMQFLSPDDQILNQFAGNQNMQIQKKYKSELRNISTQDKESMSWVRCASGNVFMTYSESIFFKSIFSRDG